MKLHLKKLLATFLALAMVITTIQWNRMSTVKAEDTVRTTVSASDEDCLDYILLNRYTDNGGNFGCTSANMGDLRWDYPSLYKLRTLKNTNGFSTLADNSTTEYRWPYMAVKVKAEVTGIYTISVNVAGNKNSTYDTMGMLVDGVVHVLKWGKSQSSHAVSAEVGLTAGTHVITFTTAMPEHPEDAAGKQSNTSAYPWFDFYGVTVDKALTLESAPTKEEVAASMATRIEAEDRTVEATDNAEAVVGHVSYDSLGNKGYGCDDADFEKNNNASGSMVVGGVSNSVLTQTETSMETYLDKKTTPYVQYTVEAPKDGLYNIRVGYLANKAAANTATDLPYCIVLVNDNAYKAQFDNEWGNLDAINLAVELKEGRNIIRCTSFTYDQFNLYDTTTAGGWACINHDYLDVQSGLTIVENGAEIPETVAGDATVVLSQNYTVNGDNLESAVQDSMRKDLPSVETLSQKAFLNVENWPFAAIKVTTTKAGYYDMTVGSSLKSVDDAIYLGVIVNGTAYGKYVAKATSNIDASVYLEEGENIVVFTAPMPLDDVTAKKVNIYNGYPWFNFLKFSLDDGMELSATAPTLDEVLASMSTRIEAEDTSYVTYDSKKAYTAKTASADETYYSNAGYAGGVAKGSIVYTFDEVVKSTDVNKYAPFVQYAVNVPEAGNYAIRLGSYIGCSTKPYVAVLVNGQAYKAQFSNTWAMSNAGLIVSLKEGINYIRVSGVTKEFIDKIGNASCWVNHDYLDVQKCITPIQKDALPKVNTANAWDTSYVYAKNFTAIKEGEVGGSNRDSMKFNRVSIETVLNALDLVTYTALKVEAENDGYYDVYMTVSSKTGDAVSSNLAMIVDGENLYKIDAALSGGKHTIGATIHLTKGTHTILVTTPMPETDAEAQAVPEGSTDGYVGENNAYPWFNFYTYSLSDGLKPVGAPTENEMLLPYTDINKDGFVNETDAIVLRKYLAGISVEINLNAADSNKDAIIDIRDIVSYKKELVELTFYPTAYLSDCNENLAIQESNYVTVYADSALDSTTGTVIEVDEDTTYRTVEGFGASFTDTSAYVLSEMPEEKQEEAIKKLFDDQDGIGLSMIRNCIGSSDFSTEYYTFQDDQSEEFALAGGQTENILKYTKKAMEYNSDMKVFLSPWTAPLWMKSSPEWTSASGAYLLDEYYDDYANYLVNTVKAYEKNKIPVYAITAQNEPWTSNEWPGMCWDYTDLITFTNKNLRPSLDEAGLDTKILNLDYNFQNWEKGALIMAATKNNTDGMAFHWYSGEPEDMENVMKYYPNELCYVTEATASRPSNSSTLLNYTNKIARSLRSGANGFMSWNIALETEGGPTLNDVNEHCSSLISFDKESGEVTYTRDYYSLAHFSKFMKKGAVRVESTDTGADTEYNLVNVVTKNIDGTMTAVLVNSYAAESKVCKIVCGGKVMEITLTPRSTVTLTWHPDFEV